LQERCKHSVLGSGEEEGKRRQAARPCFCLTAGIPGGNLGGFWIRRWLSDKPNRLYESHNGRFG
jgi:hypothetical protein